MRLRSRYPKINLEVVPSCNITLADWLLTGRVDVTILAQAEIIPELQISELAREEMVLLTGPTARPLGIVDAQELAALPLAGTASLLAIANDLLKPHGVRLRIDFRCPVYLKHTLEGRMQRYLPCPKYECAKAPQEPSLSEEGGFFL